MLQNYGMLVFLDDLVLYLHDMIPYYRLLHKVFTLLAEYKLYIKQSNCYLFLESIEFLAYDLDKESLCMEREKIILCLHSYNP